LLRMGGGTRAGCGVVWRGSQKGLAVTKQGGGAKEGPQQHPHMANKQLPVVQMVRAPAKQSAK
jgi:hypothetical protein